MTTGDKVGFVILKGEGRLYTRVKPYMYASIAEVDVDYYILNQIIPAAARVLEVFSITRQDLLSSERRDQKEKSLMDFIEKS